MKSIFLLFTAFVFSACGNSPAQTPDTDPSRQAHQVVENAAGFEARCNQGFIQGIPGILNAARTVCLVQTESYAVSTVTYANLTDYTSFPIQLQAGNVLISGDSTGTRDPEIYVGNALIGKGTNLTMVKAPVNGAIRIRFYPGTYYAVNYTFGRCFSQGNSFTPCPVPFQ